MKTMRRPKIILTALFYILFILHFSVLPVCAALGANDDDILKVGVPVDRCPMFYTDDKTGEAIGIGVDMMTVAAKEAGYAASFVPIKEANLKEALDNDEYDIIMPFGSSINSASGQSCVVSENLMQTPFTFVTVSGRNLSRINNLRVGMLSSLKGSADTISQMYPGMEIILYDTMDDCVKALRSDEVEALLHNSYVWSYVLQKTSYSDLCVQPLSIFSMDFRAGALDTPKGRAIINKLNSGIEMLTDTQRQAIILDYTSRRLYKKDLRDYIREYGVIIIMAVLLIASVVTTIVVKQRNIKMEYDEKMRQLLFHDPLTGALSLTGFRSKVEELLRTHPENTYYLSYSNIRSFKFINDTLGWEAGDELLRFWASKSMEQLSYDEAIGRLEGDHFAVLRRIGGTYSTDLDVEKVMDPVRNYFIDRGKEINVQVCTGIYALTLQDYKNADVDHMLDCARVAEKRVRDTKRDGFEFYNTNQWDKGKWIADVVGHLPVAMKNREIQVFYQPQVRFDTRDIVGAEALCRWNHPKHGWIPPSEFIPVLEEAGLIYNLDSFIWERVCEDLKRWNDKGMHHCVSVNLSRCDIRDCKDITEHFCNLIKKYHLSLDQLRIEITETAYVEDSELLINTTKKLKENGFKVEMDDFGSGYSSLNMLKEVPVERIKLDLKFLTDTGDKKKGRIIVSHMIQMGRALEMELIAEGVETAEQAQFLHDLGCYEMQGYYFHKPMPVRELEIIRDI